MRCDQPMGLSPRATQFLEQNEVLPGKCKECGRPFYVELEQIGEYEGFDKHALNRHKLQNGGFADEFVQAAPWSSGPVIFFGLRVYNKDAELMQTFLWTERQIERASR